MNYGWEITKIFFYLALILGIIYLVSYFMKKGLSTGKSGRYLNIVERLSLGPKQGLFLIKVKDKVLLIGVTVNRIEKIKEWDEDDFDGLEQQLISGHKDFKGYFQHYLNNYWRDNND